MNRKHVLLLVTCTILFFALASSVTAIFENLRICDAATEDVLDRVTVCWEDDGAPVRETIYSTTALNRINQGPFQIQGVTFLYEEPAPGEPKEIRLILTRDVSGSNEVNYSVGLFAPNRLNHLGLVLNLDGESYLVSYAGLGPLFATQELLLTHIPTMQSFTPTNFPGSNWYIFDVLGDKRIAAGAFGARFRINSLDPGEMPAAYVIPWNVTQRYEVTFTTQTPIEITDPAGTGAFTICQSDNPADAEIVQICQNNNLIFTLSAGHLTKRSITLTPSARAPPAAEDAPASHDFAFLFEIVGGVKQVSMFNLLDVHTPEADAHKINYNDFIDNMVAGRKLALEFSGDENLYLLHHPVAQFINLPSLLLTAYTTLGTTSDLPAAGNSQQVEFPTLDGGKIFVKRNTGDPPPPFDLWGLAQNELAPVNIEEQLFVSVNSLGRLLFNTPALGTVQVHSNDVRFSSAWFQLSTTNAVAGAPLTAPQNINLQLGVPTEVSASAIGSGTALFYYNLARIEQSIPIKTAQVYALYTLVPDNPDPSAAASHAYNDAFIQTFTSAHPLALKFGDSYYVLFHENPQGQLTFFDVSRLRLQTITESQTFTPVIESSTQASFAVPEGQIIVQLDDVSNRIYFQAETQQSLATVQFTPYVSELTPDNRILFPDYNDAGTNPTIIEMCLEQAYAGTDAARVCSTNQVAGQPRIIDEVVDPVKMTKIENNNYLLESNLQQGANKRVTIRTVALFERGATPIPANWLRLAQLAMANNKPAFNITGKLYLPYVQNTQLSSFALGEYPSGQLYPVRDLEEQTPITFHGSVVIGDTIVRLTQEETGVDTIPVILRISVPAQRYVPDNGDALTYNSTQDSSLLFSTRSDSDANIFTLTASDYPATGLVLLRLRGSIGIFERIFGIGDTRVITLDGQRLEIEIKDVGTTLPEEAEEEPVEEIPFSIVSVRRLSS